ncbi:MAG: glycosyltransferase family 4 protein [Bacilli bacterium]
MKKIKINMLSKADSVEGQGVGSAYLEQVGLLREGASDVFDIVINDKNDADIVHVHSINPNFYFKMKNTKGVSVCYVHFLPHTLDGSIKLPKPIFNIFKKYVIKFYNNADHLVVVNPIFIKDLEKYNIKREKITYIPNYVSKDNFYKKSKKEKDNIRSELGISKDSFVVLGVGQIQTRKGVLDFVSVAKSLPDITFVWCGGFSFGKITDGYDELKQVYENPPSNLKFLGIVPRNKMNDMFNMADLLFMPSYNELFPMAILEAVNIGIPLLLRDLDLYEDILFKKYLSGNNNDEFVLCIKKLSSDLKFYQKYSKLSDEISDYYSKENILKIWIKFYQDILKEKNKDEKVK